MILLIYSVILIPAFSLSQTPAPLSEYILSPGKLLPAPLPKKSFNIYRNLTLEVCAAQCTIAFKTRTFPCYAFEYSPMSKTCVHTNITTLVLNGGYLGLSSNKMMLYYERSKGHYANLFQKLPNVVLKRQNSYYATFHNTSLEQCAIDCLLDNNGTCMSFSYSRSMDVCGLSNTFYDPKKEALIKANLYDHYQYYTTWPCNASIPWGYTPRAIASPYFPYASLQDVSCYIRIEAPAGEEITIQFSTLYIKENICRTQNYGLAIYDGFSSTSGNLLARLCESDPTGTHRYQSTSGHLYITFATGKTPLAFKAVYQYAPGDPCLKIHCMNGGTCVPNANGNATCKCASGYAGQLCDVNIDDCATKPCILGQCVDLVNDFRCDCPSMLSGKRCETFIGRCSENPCSNGTCTPAGTNDYFCQCDSGYKGKHCDVPTDPCRMTSPCKNGGSCTNTDIGYTCTCAPGFTGSQCDVDIDECASSPCLFNVPCVDLVNDFRCECPTIFLGKRCDKFIGKCSEKPCVQGRCTPRGRGEYHCDCEAGFVGKNCDHWLGKCIDNPCVHGICDPRGNDFFCHCESGYFGKTCNNETNYCLSNPCVHGNCTSMSDTFACTCSKGYHGPRCDAVFDYCTNSPCVHGICSSLIGGFECTCNYGYKGHTCAEGVCNGVFCGQGTCHPGRDGSIMCICAEGYTGRYCNETIDYCRDKPCVNGTCTSLASGYECTCYSGFMGQTCNESVCGLSNCETGSYCTPGPVQSSYQCKCIPGYTRHSSTSKCVIDYCSSNPCIYGLCQTMIDGYHCACASGFYGNKCQYRIQPTTPGLPISTLPDTTQTNRTVATGVVPHCSENTCIHGACSDDLRYCFCYPGYAGVDCGEPTTCQVDPCMNGGTCLDRHSGFQCTCLGNFTGKYCDLLIPVEEPCQSNPCVNGGLCVPEMTGYKCVCDQYYRGSRCEIRNLCQPNPCTRGTCEIVNSGFRCVLPEIHGISNSTTSSIYYTNGVWRGRERCHVPVSAY